MVRQEVPSLGGGIGTEATSRGTYIPTYISSVEPYKGHIGNSIFVHSREAVHFLEVENLLSTMYRTVYFSTLESVLCRQVISIVS